MRLTAIDDGITLCRGGRGVPEDRDLLLQWVADRRHLDEVAESFRRTCSGYISTNRLFAIDSGPRCFDWPAIFSMLKATEDDLKGALAGVELCGRSCTISEVDRLEEALRIISEVSESLHVKSMLGSLPLDMRPMGEAVRDA